MAHTVLALIVLLNVFCEEINGNLSFASYFHDHMVLQRGPKRAIIWGYADTIGAYVTARKNGTEVGTGLVKLGGGGRGTWKIKLPAETNPGPFTITITSRDQSASLSDVMFGDVWICSGQSNMQYSLNAVYTAAQELASAEDFHDIRTLFVELKEANTEQDDFIAIKTNWARPKRGVIDLFSAVCWLYAKYLYPHLKHPIGLIESNWGGTPIEAWSSPDAMAKCTNHPRPAASWPTSPSVLWNAMIHPLLKMTIYGAIWYQGESNSDANAANYACQFPAMITDWRQKFHNASDGETDSMFPFGFVQVFRH
ncbi:hypothetical protein CHS0354_011450 [Potamilus streckersoni]|uniref:Sialate O-acetylesterase domain-containing protein n=1 Tax=Potamilus streckersoni TaxID=2493646 RepID=A0AAE0VXQ2_9BIVA|nr:hypothetical protein CHS0354_011450 [Potamilus streckersoni]